MALRFGVRPFEFQDFTRMIVKGELDINNVSYIDVVRTNLQDEFQHFEITSDLAYVLPGLLTTNVVNQLKELKTNRNYSCSVHLPIWSIEPVSPNVLIRKASVKCLIEAIELTRQLDPICWVIHATGALISEFTHINLPSFAKTFMNDHFASTAQESLNQIIDQTNISSRKLAVENVEFPFRKMEECLENLDLSICFDTGHLLAGISGDWEGGVIDFFETYHDRIVELHLHDGTSPRIDHKPLGKYDLPVREFLGYLLEKKFSGPIVFELDSDEVNESMDYIRANVPEALV